MGKTTCQVVTNSVMWLAEVSLMYKSILKVDPLTNSTDLKYLFHYSKLHKDLNSQKYYISQGHL